VLGLLTGLIDFATNPSVARRASSPAESQRGDRRLAVLVTSTLWLVVALVVALVDVLAHLLGYESPWVAGLLKGLVGGLVFGLVYVPMVTKACWPGFVATSLWLGVRRRLPLRLMGFLDDAYRLGLLRVVGPLYQFRHVDLQAIEACRRRCWRTDWVIDLDIQKFFDSVQWDLVVKAVEANTDDPWVVLYVKRWLHAPLQLPDGTLQQRDRGTPQGSAVSPVLANLFLHYAFDAWMAREFPGVTFERYVDDAVVHCVSEAHAQKVKRAIAERMEQVGLRLHPKKTRIVYCKDSNRRGSYENTEFTFLGFAFRQRRARNKQGESFSNFLPAVSKDALKRIGAEVRSWRLHLRTGHTLKDLARRINPIVAGWMQYYGAFYRSALSPLLQRINAYLMRWIRKKYKRLQGKKKARECWERITERYPRMFAHWKWVDSVQWS
jgi:RNA-directed DNA polymerase